MSEAWLVARDALAAAQHASPEPRALARAAYDALRGGDATGSLFLATLGERTLDSATAAATIVPVHRPRAEQTGQRGGGVAGGERVRALSASGRSRAARSRARVGMDSRRRTSRRRASCSRIRIPRDADALGWLALYDGNLAAARKSLRPEVESSPEALAALALLARTRADTAPVTGRAFLALARGDTAAAAAGFEKAAVGARRRCAAAARDRRAALRGASQRVSRRSRSGARSSTKSSDAPEAPEAELDWARALRQGGQNAGGDRAPRAPHPHLSAERAPAAGAPRAGAVAKRHRAAELSSARLLTFPHAFLESRRRWFCCAFQPPLRAQHVLVPMDDEQSNHLKAYGLTYAALKAGGRAEWLLNYRGGSFLLPDTPEIRRRAGLDGVSVRAAGRRRAQPDSRRDVQRRTWTRCRSRRRRRSRSTPRPIRRRGTTPSRSRSSTPGIEYTPIWDDQVEHGELAKYDWIHLLHEDFTGQLNKFYISYRDAPWFAEQQERSMATAQRARLPEHSRAQEGRRRADARSS